MIEHPELKVDERKRAIKFNEKKDEKFLTVLVEMEERVNEDIITAAHALYWPGVRHSFPSVLLPYQLY
jgi:translocation protein SEC63